MLMIFLVLIRFTAPAPLANSSGTTGRPAVLLPNALRHVSFLSPHLNHTLLDPSQDSYLKAGECVPRCGEGDRWEGGTCVPDQDQEEREEYEYEPEEEDYRVEEEEYQQEYDESDYEDDYTEEEEVLEEDPCSPNPCGQGECVIDGGGYRCRCPEDEEEKEGRCVQVTDPCEANPPPCSQMCSSTLGAPQCSCRPGFQLLPGPGGICRDIDECR